MPITSWFKKEKPLPEEPSTREHGWYDDSQIGNNARYNPDRLIEVHGIEVYRDMLIDAQVKAAFSFKVATIAGRKFRFEYDVDDPQQEEIAKFFEFAIERAFKGTFTQGIKNILSSLQFGFSVTEKIYSSIEWKGKTYWGITKLKNIPAESLKFKVDKFGNTEKILQDQGMEEKPLDPRKFLHHVVDPLHDRHYGRSDLRAVYTPYYRKQLYDKFQAIALERFAAGLAVAKSTDGKGIVGKAYDTLKKVLSNLSGSTSVILPANTDLDVIHPPSKTPFTDAIGDQNKEIAKGLLVPNLLGFSEQGKVGSNAQAKTQLEAFLLAVKEIADSVADLLNEEYFRELAWWNFGVTNYPLFIFEDLTAEQKTETASAWGEAIKSGSVVNTIADENTTRDLLGYGNREEVEGEEPAEEKPAEPEPEPDEEPDVEKPDSGQQNLTRVFQEEEARGEPTWINRVDFKLIGNYAATETASLSEQITLSVADLYNAMIAEVEANGLYGENADPEEINKLKLDKGIQRDLNRLLTDGLEDSYGEGRTSAITEITKAAEGSQFTQVGLNARRTKRSAIRFDKKIGKYVEGLDPSTAGEFFDSKAFHITGVLSDEVLNKSKSVLLNSITTGSDLPTVQAELETILTPILETEVDSAGRPINIPARVETIARTNILESFNQARLSVFNDPEIGDFVQAYEYSATIDSRTSDFCSAMDGKVYPKGSAEWGGRMPPAHFNCRSLLIAVTAVDVWNESSALPSDIVADPGFQ